MARLGTRIANHLERRLHFLMRYRINRRNRRRLHNDAFSLLASNCNGGHISHDLGLRHRSPTVNLFMDAENYIVFLENLEYYLQQDLTPVDDPEHRYPVGRLGDVEIHFVHYNSFDEARAKWVERCGRVDLNNLFVMMTERDGCSSDVIRRFDDLPYRNKVIFTRIPYPQFRSAYYIKGFEDEGCVGVLSEPSDPFGARYYDEFDYVAWFNAGLECQE